MTDKKQYIEIARTLERKDPLLFDRLKEDINPRINIEELFTSFCIVTNTDTEIFHKEIYNRKLTKIKLLFIAVLLKEFDPMHLPHGSKKKVSSLLNVSQKKIGGFFQNATFFLSVYPDFKKEVSKIYSDILKQKNSLSKNKYENNNQDQLS